MLSRDDTKITFGASSFLDRKMELEDRNLHVSYPAQESAKQSKCFGIALAVMEKSCTELAKNHMIL